MGWPKGVKRVGYVRKDGQAHAPKGARLKARIEVIRKDEPKYQQTETTDTTDHIEKAIHGATGRPIIEPCPNCGFAYADGGYCSDCGWTTWKGKKAR